MATPNRYPLSTADGKAVPLDVVKPLACIPLDMNIFTFTSITIPAAYVDKLFVIEPSADCYISMIVTPVAVVPNAINDGVIFCSLGSVTTIVANSTKLSVMSIANSGVCHIQVLDTWAAIALESQITKR